MEQAQDSVTFEIQIEEYLDFTWQGKLRKEGRSISFRSEVELLRAINELLCTDREASCCWNAAK